MKKCTAFMLGIIILLIAESPAFSSSLSEIADFCKEICDEISMDGNIRREKIEGKIEGEMKGIARLLGASFSADGNIMIDDTKYKGIPYDKLPDQMINARECRKELTIILLKERQEIEQKKATQIDEAKQRKSGWYGFLNSQNIDREDELRKQCNEEFTRVHVDSGTTFNDLCKSIGLSCKHVCDWKGNGIPCDDSPYSWGDGARLGYCE